MGNASRSDDESEIHDYPHHQGKRKATLQKLSVTGWEVVGMGAAEVLHLLEAEDNQCNEEPKFVCRLAEALRDQGVLLFHAPPSGVDSHSLSPQQIRDLYARIHTVAYPDLVLEEIDDSLRGLQSGYQKLHGKSTSIRSKTFPGYPESALIGSADEVKLLTICLISLPWPLRIFNKPEFDFQPFKGI